ncbi:hypothetical protein Kurepalu1_00017 [Pseudomonas phage vB_PpuP-Kurepalu-1]
MRSLIALPFAVLTAFAVLAGCGSQPAQPTLPVVYSNSHHNDRVEAVMNECREAVAIAVLAYYKEHSALPADEVVVGAYQSCLYDNGVTL